MKVIIVVILFLAIKLPPSAAIIAGDPINIEDAPYMVFVQEVINLSRGFVEKCGGSIIRDRVGRSGARVAKFVVTAARCVVDSPSLVPKSPKDFYLLFASTERGGIDTMGEFVDGIAKVYMHPGYRGYGSPHDIAILEMKDEIELDGVKKRAIKLADEHEGLVELNTECTVSGWGDNPANMDSKQLFRAAMHVESYESCAEQYGKYTNVELLMKHQICALGSSSNYSNICHGDYGSPLVRKSDETLLGIASFGRRCDNSNSSGNFLSIYTKITDNLDFINYVTKSYQ